METTYSITKNLEDRQFRWYDKEDIDRKMFKNYARMKAEKDNQS